MLKTSCCFRSYVSFAYTTEPKFCIFLLPACNEAPSDNPITTTLALQKCDTVNGLTDGQSTPHFEEHIQSGSETTKGATELQNPEEPKQEMTYDIGQIQGLPTIKQETQRVMENQKNYFLNGKTPSEAGGQHSSMLSTGINQTSIGFGTSFSEVGSFLDSRVDRATGGEMDRANGNTITTKPKNN